jgi:hypothetical protein
MPTSVTHQGHTPGARSRPRNLAPDRLDNSPVIRERALGVGPPILEVEPQDLIRESNSEQRGQGEQDRGADHAKHDCKGCVHQYQRQSRAKSPTVGGVLRDRPPLHGHDDRPAPVAEPVGACSWPQEPLSLPRGTVGSEAQRARLPSEDGWVRVRGSTVVLVEACTFRLDAR